MGSRPWEYIVPYQKDIAAALAALRRREFEAGRYYKDETDDPDRPSRSIEEAVERSAPTGTRSVLDMTGGLSDAPRDGCVAPLSREQLRDCFGTDRPTRDRLERRRKGPPRRVGGRLHQDALATLGRGQGAYVVLYDTAGEPSEILFRGYSYD